METRFPLLDPLDRRLNVRSPGLADIRLRGVVEAERYAEGRPAHVVAPVADLRREPRHDCGLDHQILLGDDVVIFDEKNGWAWVQAGLDGYVGWTSAEALAPGPAQATHRVAVPRTFVYPGPDLKFPSLHALSMGSRLDISGEAETRGTRYLLLAGGGAVIASHLVEARRWADDYVAVARQLLGAPYLWGGASGFGVDCSGLVHLAMRQCGRSGLLRDSDMQAAALGEPLDPGEDYSGLRRGDLVFWRGHVAIAEGDGNLLHASGNTMLVTSEPVMQAIERIARLWEQPIGVRRP